MTNINTLFQPNLGTSIGSGYIGEILASSQSFSGLGLNPSSYGAALSLTPGTWLCILHGSFQAQVPTDALVRLADNSNVVISTDSLGAPTIVDCGNSGGGSDIKTTFVLRVTTTTTYKVNIGAVQPAGATNTAYFTAIRIA